jgi:hypothetical protein
MSLSQARSGPTSNSLASHLFLNTFVCAMAQVIHGEHAYSISCHHVTYLFPFFAHSASDL